MDRRWAGLVLAAVAAPALAAGNAHDDAVAFGAREGVEQASLSPDGRHVAFLVPTKGQGSTLFTVSTDEGATPRPALAVSGSPDRLSDCHWVANDRLVCTIWGMVKSPDTSRPMGYSRLVAVDADGGNQRLLYRSAYSQGRFGGNIIDWLPGSDGDVLMMTRTSAVERINTRTLKLIDIVEKPRTGVGEYITDGEGNVRIAGYPRVAGQTFQSTGTVAYRFRPANSREWQPLNDYDSIARQGFNPYTVDPVANVAYGFREQNGRLALYTKALDGSGQETLLLSRPDVDVDGLVRIGRRNRVVGASYATDRRVVVYFDRELDALSTSLGKALPKSPQVTIVDASADESRLLIFAGSDDDPGTYYVLDKATKKLQMLLQKRPDLAERKLANVRPITLRMRDGATIPAYLTLPPGGAAKGLPAIVMPHGGPASRDEWGFDWLPQYFAARGYAVLQPNFRGSEGYGDDFQLDNGIRSWRTAIGDVTDAGRWLVSEGIADPAKLGIVGWSYGGYAALQSVAMEPGLFKASVAIAPVVDFQRWREELRDWNAYRVRADYIGTVDRASSPLLNAEKIGVPVLLVHGRLDSNVLYGQSEAMAARLKALGRKVDMIGFDTLDHGLSDGEARATVLERADAHLRAAMGI